MTEAKHHEDASGANKVKLILAWTFVGNTLAKAVLLFK